MALLYSKTTGIGVNALQTWGSRSSPFLLSPPSSLRFPPSPFPLPLNSTTATGVWGCCKLPSGSGQSRATKRILVHLRVKMKRFWGQISWIFNRQNLKVLLWTCFTTALTTKSIMLTKIVHRRRDCVGIIAGSNTLMVPCRSNIGFPDPCDPCGVDAFAFTGLVS